MTEMHTQTVLGCTCIWYDNQHMTDLQCSAGSVVDVG